MTRSLKNAVLQQQKFDVDKALQILDQETPPLVVDGEKLKVCGILWASGLFSSLLLSLVRQVFCILTLLKP